jgi:prephenate dehydrogenase
MPHEPTTIAAVRGATTVPMNRASDILEGSTRLLETLMSANSLRVDQIVSALFTCTADLDADFPAHAARRMGWESVPMLCAREIPVPGSLPRVVRVMLTVRVPHHGAALTPVYLGEAAALRPDLASPRGDATVQRRVAIIGLGQIGGSIGLGLRGRGWRRMGFDRDTATLADALAAGAIDEAAEDIRAACANAELAVVAVPVDGLAAAIENAAAALPTGAALLDTGSARSPLSQALSATVGRGIAAVGGHPLAGTEGRGFAAARRELFRDAPFLLMPVGNAVPAIVAAFVEDLGAIAVVTDAATHDEALARTSHLPYLLSCELRALGSEAEKARLSGPGFRDMTRLARSDPAMAGAYCRANVIEIEGAWMSFRAAMDARVQSLRRS